MRAEVIVVTESGSQARARLDVFVGEWVVEARFPGGEPAPSIAKGDGPQARSQFEWALDGQWEHDFDLIYRRAGSHGR